MKKLIVAMTVLVAGVSAHAARPSWTEISQAKTAYVKNHAGIKARVAYLGGTAFTAVENANNRYTITTNNGCAFNARIAYSEFGFNPSAADKGFDGLSLSKSVCN
ncbi:hypothetical protein AZI86_02180 [Bdellovibrio bacteriovorus]|uniref:Uncharacterized protein n=1 Tax=Bdellovibrio bacteriovorus TaxID=959 RepID=A0A150WNG3_BDEBC|nr:hypothetical protein [Bdellovibrio bacteriovorus]KYG65904.1 hypothetical protein AZI86_02180 [Bdellovibrio bacteriovorus]